MNSKDPTNKNINRKSEKTRVARAVMVPHHMVSKADQRNKIELNFRSSGVVDYKNVLNKF